MPGGGLIVIHSTTPNCLACIALQAVSYMGARLSRGPIAPCQSQFDRKLPPGSRQKPERSDFRIATVSARQPWILSAGINDATPTRNRRSEEHTSELQSLMRISYAVFCLKKKKTQKDNKSTTHKKTKNR